MRVLSVVGARPQFVKLAPVDEQLVAAGHEHVIVHTGQHYDTTMSEAIFADLAIPEPDVNLGVGSASHGVQTGQVLAAMDGVLDQQRPDWVLVYGDTNSTLAGALAAVKAHVPVAHLEAGLRSFNRRMPEEHNRVLTDHCADLLLCPTATAVRHLAAEGLSERAVLVGDVMTDVCFRVRDEVARRPSPVPAALQDGPFLAATLHRAENTDDPERLAAVLGALAALALPVLLMAHPRLVARAAAAGLHLDVGALHVRAPMTYRDMVATVMASHGVVTDSGGLQKEAYLLGKPCTTLRTETEWTETLEDGWNVLSPDLHGLGAIASRSAPGTARSPLFGDGHAAGAVVRALR